MSRPFSQDWEHKVHGSSSSMSSSPAITAATAATGLGQSAANVVRPVSEGAGSNSRYTSKEAEAIDSWFDDLNNYERTLEQMADMAFVDNFKEEMQAVMGWFLSENESEKTTIIYALLKQCSQLQVRFFLMVLQQMAKKDPIASLLSPRVSMHEMGWCSFFFLFFFSGTTFNDFGNRPKEREKLGLRIEQKSALRTAVLSVNN